MPAKTFAHLLAILPWLGGCSAYLPRCPSGQGPFLPGAGPGAEAGAGWYWVFVGGLAAGVLLAWLWRRLRLRRARAGKGAPWRPRDLELLGAALLILEELLAGWRRRGVVVRISEWLAARGRSSKK